MSQQNNNDFGDLNFFGGDFPNFDNNGNTIQGGNPPSAATPFNPMAHQPQQPMQQQQPQQQFFNPQQHQQQFNQQAPQQQQQYGGGQMSQGNQNFGQPQMPQHHGQPQMRPTMQGQSFQQPQQFSSAQQGLGQMSDNSNNAASTAVHGNMSFQQRMHKYDNEPPLLEELGVDFGLIRRKTTAVLLPTAPLPRQLATDVDLGGPLVFCLALGVCLMLTGKLHFGYIFGFGVTGCVLMYMLLNLMTSENVSLDLTFSILGYSLLPIVLVAFLNIFITLSGWFGFVICVSGIAWCTLTATRYIQHAFDLVDQRYLIGYPVALFYVCFALISVF